MKEAPIMVSFGWSGEKREIKVEQKDGKWVTTHIVDGQPDAQMTRMFGTNQIPTPWTSDVDREKVIEELAVRNPNSTVS